MSKVLLPQGSLSMNASSAERRSAAPRPVASKGWTQLLTGTWTGASAGLLAGIAVGIAEACVVIASAQGPVGTTVLFFGAMCYGLFGAVAGTLAALTFQRFARFRAWSADARYALIAASIMGVVGFALTAFRVRRDFFHEELVWKSASGIGVLGACALASVLLSAALYVGLARLLRKTPARFLLTSWGTPALFVLVTAALSVVSGVSSSVGATAGNDAPHVAGVDAASQRHNVLFIVVDTLRADHLPSYGYEGGSTPSLDQFAQDAVRFERAYANASWTRPSFASLLTGRYASSHGVMGKADALPGELDTLPEELGKQGYKTAGFVTNYNVAPFFNFQQGFDRYTYIEPNFVLGADDASAKLLLVQTLRKVIEKVNAKLGRVEAGAAYQDAERVNQEVFHWLGEEDTDPKPWFLFVGYMDPHDPYFPHPYNGSGYSRAAHPHPSTDEASALRELYDGEISYWDAHFGRLVAKLKETGTYDDTMIIVTSDHGEEFGEHGGFWHGTTLYDEQLHVPLLVKLPGNAQGGSAVGHWVQSIDIMPTIFGRLGLPLDARVQGGDLFEGTDILFAEESHEGNQLESLRRKIGTVGYKLISANAGNPRGLDPIELYDVTRDPNEQANLAEAQPGRVEELSESLIAVGKVAAEGAAERQNVEISEREQERLERLGYGEKD